MIKYLCVVAAISCFAKTASSHKDAYVRFVEDDLQAHLHQKQQ